MKYSNINEIDENLKNILTILGSFFVNINNEHFVINNELAFEHKDFTNRQVVSFPFSFLIGRNGTHKISKTSFLKQNLKTFSENLTKVNYSSGGTHVDVLETNLTKTVQDLDYYNGNLITTSKSHISKHEINGYSYFITGVKKFEFKSKQGLFSDLQVYFLDSYNFDMNFEKNQLFYSLEQLEQQIIL